MSSPHIYPSSRYRSPSCTFQDFCNGLNFTTFSSFYQQLNPYSPPSLEYIQQHWIVLVNELFPTGFDERQRAFQDSPIGQKLKFQAFEDYSGGQDIGVGGSFLCQTRDQHIRKLSKTWTVLGKEEGHPEMNTDDFELDRDQCTAERVWSDVQRAQSAQIGDSSSEQNRSFVGLTISEVLSEADPPADNSMQVQAARASNCPTDGQEQGHSRKDGRGARPSKQNREACSPGPSSAVVSSAFAADPTTEEQALQNRKAAQASTRNLYPYSVVVEDRSCFSSLASLAAIRSQDGLVHFSFASNPERVDPCSLSQLELEIAIADLLTTVRCEMHAIHPDRAMLLEFY